MAIYSISTSDTAKYEGSAGGSTAFTYTITRSGDLSAAGSVDWVLFAGQPAPATLDDFASGTAITGTAQFAAGVASVDLVFNVTADSAPEPDEGFGVYLRNPAGADTVDPANAIASSVILDDDALHLLGTPGKDTFDNSLFTKGTVADLSQGGNDKFIGSAFDDTVLFGAAFGRADVVDGGAGYNRIVLDGDYSAGLRISPTMMVNVQEVDLESGFNYNLAFTDGNVAAGATLVVNATALSAINGATVNGGSELDGSFSFLGGAGNDVFKGGAMADTFNGGYGADQLNGGAGADIFVYREALDSPLVTDISGTIQPGVDDTLVSFQAAFDKIDLSAFNFLGDPTAVLQKPGSSFTANTASGAGFFDPSGAAVAVEYAKVGKVYEARVYVDVNQDGNLGTGDMMIQVTGVRAGAIGAKNFIF